jgi:hypothetical protein
MKIKTIQKTHTQKDGTIWEWVETPELTKFIQNQTKNKKG